MATLRELIVKFSLKADTKAVKSFSEALDGAIAAAADLAAWGAKLVAGYSAVGGVLAATAADAANFAEEAIRSATAFGISVRSFQELNFAFLALGASSDDLADALGTLTDRAVDAIEGSKNYRKEFERIGIAVDDLRDKQPDEILNMWVEAATNAESETAAITSAVRLLGDDLGRRVARGLRASGSSFKDYIRILNRAGGVFDRAMLEKAQDAQIQFRLLGATLSMLRRRIGLELAPVFGDFAARIVAMFAANVESIDEFVLALKEGVRKELERLIIWAKTTDRVVRSTFGGWGELAETVAASFAGAVALITGTKIVGFLSTLVPLFKAASAAVGLVTLPLVLLAGAIIGTTLLFEDLWIEIQGGESFIGEVIDRLGEMGPLGEFIAWGLGLVIDNFSALVDEASELWSVVGGPLMSILEGLVGLLAGALFGALISAVNGFILTGRIIIGIARIIGWFIGLLGDFTDLLADSFRKFPAAFENFWNQLVALIDATIFDPVIGAVQTLLRLLESLPGRALQALGLGTEGFDIDARRDSGRLIDAVQGARGGSPRGGAGGPVSQSNSVKVDNVNIAANSEAEGAAAARGFQKELENSTGGFFERAASFVESTYQDL